MCGVSRRGAVAPRRAALPAVLMAMLMVVVGCGAVDSVTGSRVSSDLSGPETTLRVLAGSELVAMEPVLEEAARATGVHVDLEYTGTLTAAQRIAECTVDGSYDAVWFSSNRYLDLRPETRGVLGTSVEIMSSPVVLGLRRSVAERLGFTDGPVDWARIAAAAGAGEFTYGMTDPSASNSGFSAVVAVATALVGSGAALTEQQAASTAPALTDFFSAQTLSAGSSGFLQEAYIGRATGADPGPAVDGLINYESVLLSMNAAGNLPEPLELIYPTDGVVTADYPFTVLNSASEETRDAHRRLTEYLRTTEVQQRIMDSGHWRPAIPGVPLAAEFGTATLVELPFPASSAVVDTLLTSWFDKVRRASRTIYVLDTSGSMDRDNRMPLLHSALARLAGADTSLVGQFRRFRGREEVVLLPFASAPKEPKLFTVPQDDPQPVLDRIAAEGNALTAGGETAIYTTLEAAYVLAEVQIQADPDRFTSIVLMTDGENTTGADFAAFRNIFDNRPNAVRAVPVFPVLFGESNVAEMEELAAVTGGRTFDARDGSLDAAFTEIRGYV